MKKFSFLSLILLPAILFSFTGSGQAQNVTIDLDSTFQTIRGFGAANIVDWYGQDLTMDDVDVAYGTGEGTLGFNILRLRISPNPADWDNGNQIETARKAHEMGALVWAAPWNPPADMYDPNSDQRKVDPTKYDLYAAHLDSFRVFMENNGVPIYAISVQNEPDYANDWTAWEPEEVVTFLRDYAPMIGTKVMSAESFQFRLSYYDPILTDSLATANTDIIGGHIYGGGIAKYPLAAEKDKEVWMTEHYTSSDRSANMWPDALEVGKEIHRVMNANWNAYVWWQIKRYYSPIHDGVDADTDNFVDRASVGSITKRGWVMSQFSRFIRPGYTRVFADGPYERGYVNVLTSAYVDSARSKMVIVAVNGESAEKDINVNLNGLTTHSFSRYITSEDDNVEQLDDLQIEGFNFSATLPANSITTFVSSDLVATSVEEPLAAPLNYQLHQNYPNPFNPGTSISYHLPVNSNVTLKVFDAVGREVATLVNGQQSAGEHSVNFNAAGLSSGVYLYRLETGNFVSTKKMLLIK
ncbi:MAG TPA: hypothetical protein DEQ34_04945 [Balneolaceae bacterium]|nr:hypothetical protein [Balneolaceae bacterium]|tara:strand:- start:37913 stop:39487 length:1575 start_codon:yes stop_codon:yes gene_type:complete